MTRPHPGAHPLVAAVLLLAAAGCACARKPPYPPDRIGPEVVRVLRETGSARVMVALTLPPSVPTPDARREAIAALQTRVLDALDASLYADPHRFVAVPALTLTLRSEEALDILNRHPAVERVDLELAGRGS